MILGTHILGNLKNWSDSIPYHLLSWAKLMSFSAGGCTADGDYCDYFLRPTAHCTSPARDDGKTTLQFADGTDVLDPRKKV